MLFSRSVMSDSFVTAQSRQAPLSTGFSKIEYWSGLPFPSPGDLPNPGIEPTSALADGFFTTEPSGKHLGNSSSFFFFSRHKWHHWKHPPLAPASHELGVGVGQREGRVERARREPAMPRQPAVLTLISVCSLPHPACCLYLLHPSVPTPVL